MKRILTTLAGVMVATAGLVHAQEIYIFDQQSSSDETSLPGPSGGVSLHLATYGQSFTPTLSSVDFVRLKLADGFAGNGVGATMSVVLRADSPEGPILASTDPVMLVDGFRGFAEFRFADSVGLIPGESYLFEPTITLDSDSWSIHGWEYNYPGGNGYRNGIAVLGADLWFREGIILVPEPSALALLALGLGGFAVRRKMRASRRRAGINGRTRHLRTDRPSRKLRGS